MNPRYLVFFSGLFLIYSNKAESSVPANYLKRFQKLIYKPLQEHDGPNCFQSVAYITGLTNRLSYLSDQEFILLLKKFNCVKLEKTESIKSGDIALLSSDILSRGEARNYEHAFMWDHYPDYIIEKIGSYSSFKLKQSTLKESENWTLFKKECLDDPDKCRLKLSNFRCPQYLTETPWQGSPKLEEQRKTIDKWMLLGESPLINEIKKINNELKSFIEETKLEKEEATSLLRQVQIFQDPN